jgi:hypothetical protein
MIAVGSKVYLRGCAYGQPGTVVRIERNRAVVLWHDLDYLARHSPESLMEAENGNPLTLQNGPESPEKSPQFSQVMELGQ